MAKQIEFWTLLRLTQEYISQQYASVLTDKNKLNQLKSYIDKYLRDNDYHVENLTTKELIDKLYCEMAEYSVLTPFLGSPDLEEINVNGWDDIALTYLDGSIVKLKDHFHSPQHAVDIIKRLLHHSGMIIDNATPTAQGHLPGNTRITALKDPMCIGRASRSSLPTTRDSSSSSKRRRSPARSNAFPCASSSALWQSMWSSLAWRLSRPSASSSADLTRR